MLTKSKTKNMKRYIYNIFNIASAFAVLSILFFSCDEDGDSVGVSTVTYFPSFELTAGDNVVITKGTSFTPEAVVMEGENVLTPTITNGVDNAVPGVYQVLYSALNSDGYSGAKSQQVIVYDPAIIPTDVTGNIADIGRPERKGVITLVPGTTNIYHCTDMGFGGLFPLYFQMEGDIMTVIPQAFAFGVTSVDASYDPVTKQFSTLMNPQGFAYNFQYE
ncbi:MAG: hypothetical protein ACJA08_001244 [Cyclobacteriaceae bacterium]|jgi:hypothetical protein